MTKDLGEMGKTLKDLAKKQLEDEALSSSAEELDDEKASKDDAES